MTCAFILFLVTCENWIFGAPWFSCLRRAHETHANYKLHEIQSKNVVCPEKLTILEIHCFHIKANLCVLCVLLTLILTFCCCFRFVAWLWITCLGACLYYNITICLILCIMCVSGWIRFWEKARFLWIRRWGTNCTLMETLWRGWACWDVCVRWRDRSV